MIYSRNEDGSIVWGSTQLSSSRMVQLGAERKVLTLIRNFVIEIFVERDCGEKGAGKIYFI